MKYLIPVIPLVAVIGVAAAQAPLPPPPAPAIALGPNAAAGLPEVPDSALPTFEVASVKVNKNGPTSPMMARMLPGRLEATNMPVRFLFQQAYRLPTYQMQGGPAWLDSERFDIRAKAPEGTPQDQLSLMVRALLIERFKLVAHRETKEAPIYELVMARSDGRLGPKLSKTTDDCEAIMAERRAAARARGPGQPPFTPPGPNERPVCTMNMMPLSREQGAPFVLRMRAGGQTMDQLVRTLSGYVSRPVIDRTGLTGLYDYELEISPMRMLNVAPTPAAPGGPAGPAAAAPIDDGPTIFESVQQLGLKLESTKGPVEYLVIDSVEKPVDD
jgi:uncharacterized protein (TIGR03435 family)